MSKYVRLTRTVSDKGILVTPEDVPLYIKDNTVDHYVSTYYYNQDHYNQFQQTGSVKGFKDTKADKIWWDFDDAENLKNAKLDTIELINRLNKQNIKHPEIYFSGRKGFCVIVNLSKELTRKQVENFALRMAKDLKTFDPTLYDESQLLRIPGTKHQKTEYYKTPLTYTELVGLSKTELLEKAKKKLSLKEASPSRFINELEDHLFEVKEVVEEMKQNALATFDLSTKPRNWKASKWALMQGFFKQGERNQTMMILSATCKAMGYDDITSYYMCKSALQKSWERYGKGDFTKEELWSIIERTFEKDNIGQYSEKDDAFLIKKAEELGIKELTTSNTVDIKGALKIHESYAKNINNLTLKTGIAELDRKLRITVGMSWGIIAAPGVGKTTIALNMLHSMSKSGELCIFFSYDMYAPLVVQKIIQRHWEEDDMDEVFRRYEAGDFEYTTKIHELVEKEYPNVEFCFESGQNIDDIYRTIREIEQKRSKKCKFVVIDYNELVITDVSDPTQSSNYVAQKIRELASKEQVCVLSLFQPSKLTGDPSTEIMSFRAAKGGSGIEQSVSVMFGVSRPGFNPRKPEDDKYLSINCVKNRMGSIFSLDLYWNGYRGEVRSLSPEEKTDLRALRKAKEEENSKKIWDYDDG